MGKMDPKQNHESSLSLKKDRDRQRLKNKGNFKKGLWRLILFRITHT